MRPHLAYAIWVGSTLAVCAAISLTMGKPYACIIIAGAGACIGLVALTLTTMEDLP